ncbi:MAG: PAS domain-containing sensor histidine kinase [Promethearchaeota archaeon]|nr:MAG: PAS domain-containing sensor histidine kinase [Candidatus Lokiarchaeota archaeon]
MNEKKGVTDAIKISSPFKEKFYDIFFKTFPDPLFVTDIYGKIIDVSDSLLNLWGIKRKKEELIGQSGFKFLDPKYLRIVKKDHQKALEKGHFSNSLYKIRRKDGQVFYIKISASLIKDANDNPRYFIGVLRDITNEKKLRTELKKNKEMFQLVLDNIPQFIFWKDIDSVYLGCNKNFSRVAGVGTPDNIIGKTDFNLPWEKSQAESFYEIDRLVMESNKPEFHIIETQLQADGKEAWLDTNKIPLHNSKGEVVGLLGTYEDITERVLAKKALEKSEKKYRHLFDNSPYAIALLDLKGNIVDCNDTVKKFLTELTKKDIIGRNIYDMLLGINKDKIPMVKTFLYKIVQGRIHHSFELKLNKRNGEAIWLSVYASVLNIEDETLIQLMVTDITEKKLAEDKIIESEKKYRESYSQANLYKDLFAHDISNILQSIKSANEIMEIFLDNPQKSKEIREVSNIIKEQILRGARLVDNIHKLSQIEGADYLLKKTNLNETLKDSIEFLYNWVPNYNLNIEVDSAEENVVVNANELLYDVFENLLINAVKYNKNDIKEILIKISKKEIENKIYVQLEFLDNGIGVEDVRKNQIFQRAYNKDKSVRGFGLGLSLVKKIIESYDGKIWVEDRIKGDHSKGSNFIILLP